MVIVVILIVAFILVMALIIINKSHSDKRYKLEQKNNDEIEKVESASILKDGRIVELEYSLGKVELYKLEKLLKVETDPGEKAKVLIQINAIKLVIPNEEI